MSSSTTQGITDVAKSGIERVKTAVNPPKFGKHPINNSMWMKIGNDGSCHAVKLNEGGNLFEMPLDTSSKWNGQWELLKNGNLRMVIGGYVMTFNKRLEGLRHVGSGESPDGQAVTYELVPMSG